MTDLNYNRDNFVALDCTRVEERDSELSSNTEDDLGQRRGHRACVLGDADRVTIGHRGVERAPDANYFLRLAARVSRRPRSAARAAAVLALAGLRRWGRKTARSSLGSP
jgi:hypothetical protein